MKSPEYFIGMKVMSDLDDLKMARHDFEADGKNVFVQRFEPHDYFEGMHFYKHGAAAYEIYIICNKNGIEELNYRVEPSGCNSSSVGVKGIGAHNCPDGAMFDIKWVHVAAPVKDKMIKLLEAISEKKKPESKVNK
jgi:hypothetical protein